MSARVVLCDGEGCEAELRYSGRGRPPKFCKQCRNTSQAAKQRAYYEQNKDEIAAKQRAYYEQNKDEIAAKKRAYREQNKDEIAAKQRAYREQNKDEIAAKQRAYYEQNKDEIAAKKRAREGKVCGQCGEHLRQQTVDGLCGFCHEEAVERQAA
jgi:hypothetical protein